MIPKSSLYLLVAFGSLLFMAQSFSKNRIIVELKNQNEVLRHKIDSLEKTPRLIQKSSGPNSSNINAENGDVNLSFE